MKRKGKGVARYEPGLVLARALPKTNRASGGALRVGGDVAAAALALGLVWKAWGWARPKLAEWWKARRAGR